MKVFLPVVSILITAIALGGCKTQPTPATTLRERGDRYYALGEYSEAATEYQEIAYRYPGDWPAQYRLGLCLLELDRPGEARSALQIAYTRQPQNEEVLDAFAEALYRDGAEEQLFTMLRHNAKASGAVRDYLRLARFSLRAGDPDSARRAIDIAIDLDSTGSAAPYLVAADLAESIGDEVLLLRRLRQAYGREPDNAEVARRLRAMGEVPGPTIALPPGR